MSTNEKNLSKAAGGLARASVLSAERRREIAQQAALKRWAGNTPRKTNHVSSVRKLKGIPASRKFAVTTDIASTTGAMVNAVITENAEVIRTFTGTESVVQACVSAYFDALRDLGIGVDVTHYGVLQ